MFPDANGTRTARAASGPGHLTSRRIGPIAVEAEHAVIDTPGYADEAEPLPDRVIDPALHAVRQDRRSGAEPARDVVQTVGTPRDRADFFVARDGQGRLPEFRFLLGELGCDLLQHRRIEARRN